MSLQIKLRVFEGPLDLLLHLIEKNKVNIYDIPIVQITDQYMEYIDAFKTRDMDVMSDFLVMAATLLRIKSQMLLPAQEVDEEGEPVDPRTELVEKLLEYKMYKYFSYELKDRQLDAAHMLFKESTVPDEVASYKPEVNVEEILNDVSLGKLQSIFNDIVKRKFDRIDPIRSKFGKIEKEDANLYQIILDLQTYGLEQRHFSFRKYMERSHSRMEMIISFLAILELIKMGRIKIKQNRLFDDIIIDYLADDITPVEEIMQA
ncbi:MAG: segregation/condensation protein A [Lachnospiraceae bacterium]|nr:segregation/condensation protein A [Lachnospiraceae bacterium]